MRKILIALVGLMLITSVSLASPLMDYSPGKTAIDIDIYPGLDTHLTNNAGYNASPKGKSGNFDWGITTGLGNKFAIQYRQFDPQTKFIGTKEIVKLATQEVNVLYLLDKNVAVFAGFHQSKIKDTYSGLTTDSYNKNIAQFGLVGSTQIADKTKLFGIIGVGDNFSNFEVGLSYNIAPGLEINVTYRDLNSKAIRAPGSILCNAEFKGIGYGLTYKF